jgi:OOP family OmpA-OmpF porin
VIDTKLIAFVLFIVFSLNQDLVCAQKEVSPESILEKQSTMSRLAKEANRTGDKYLAIEYYEALYDNDSTNFSHILTLASLYRRTNNYAKTEMFYEKITLSSKIGKYPEAYFYLAQAQKNNQKYAKAKKNLMVFKKLRSDVKDPIIKKLYKTELEGCEMALAPNPDSTTYLVKSIGNGANHPHIDFSPIPMGDDQLIYGSYEEDKERIYLVNDSNAVLLKKRVFLEAQKIDGEWKSTGTLDGPFNDPSMDIANGCFSMDSSKFYFSKCETNWQYKMVCSIFESKKVNGTWSEPERLSELVNMTDFTSSHPTFGRESRRNNEILYFVSDREGSRGGTDIWFSEFDSRKKKWKKARNAGSKINSVGNETTPFYDLQSKTLYFSTDGKPNYGGLDIYSAIGETSKWAVAENMGPELNSSADDLDYVIKKSNRGGFFVSNRIGGQSLYHQTCCDDIYEFEFAKYIDIFTTIAALDKDENTPLDAVVMNLYLIDENGKLLIQTLDENSDINKFDLRPNQNYRIEVKKEGYFPNHVEFSTDSIFEATELKNVVELEKYPLKPIVIPNINFEFGSSDLTKGSKNIIDTTLLVLFQRQPDIIIEISAHTDNVGRDSYNLTLSQQRAESLVKYLNSKDVPLNQMIPKGYGESNPIELNKNADGSDNPEGRRVNRRIEILILGVIDPELMDEDEDEND